MVYFFILLTTSNCLFEFNVMHFFFYMCSSGLASLTSFLPRILLSLVTLQPFLKPPQKEEDIIIISPPGGRDIRPFFWGGGGGEG